MDIGSKIKYYREKKGMTQEQLGKEICAKSYLSKIENNKAEASKEILNLLCERLGISLDQNDPKVIEEINKNLDEWYEVIKNRDKEKAQKIEESIVENISNIEDPTTLIQFQLYSLRYQLLLRNLNESETLIQKLKANENNFFDKQKYYFFYFYGLYKYLQDDLIESLEYYSKAEKIDKLIKMNEPEFIYSIALVHGRLNHTSIALYYGNLALEKFNEKMDYFRSIETQIINISEAIFIII